MPNQRKVTPNQIVPGFPSRMWNGLVDLLDAPASQRAGVAGSSLAQGVIVKVYNGTGADRGRFDCAAIGDTRFEIGTDGKESVIFDLEAADPDKPAAILLEPIADTKRGNVLIFGYCLAKIATASNATDLAGTPNATNHNLDAGEDGPVRILSSPSTSAASVRPVLIGAGGSGTPIALYRYTLTTDMTASGATCSAQHVVTGSVLSGQQIIGVANTADSQTAGDGGLAALLGGTLYVVEPDCNFDNFGLDEETESP